MPEMSPPPPTGAKIASMRPGRWRRISIPTVPWPAITSGSSYGCTNTRPSASPRRCASAAAAVVRVAVEHDPRAERLDRAYLDRRRRERHHDERRRDRACAPPAPRLARGCRPTKRRPRVRARGIEPAHLVVGAADLERERRLLVLALEKHRDSRAARTATAPPRGSTRARRRRLRAKSIFSK